MARIDPRFEKDSNLEKRRKECEPGINGEETDKNEPRMGYTQWTDNRDKEKYKNNYIKGGVT
uniref:Uncharacterized protein n=1 Tax=Pristionchus pacificus TaxID=54126 RepID=A0A2A6C744_PRIPA|eukprot:PDM74004.1 hypothetical protein PRIPAC_41360 [Pristionchus pacificus]